MSFVTNEAVLVLICLAKDSLTPNFLSRETVGKWPTKNQLTENRTDEHFRFRLVGLSVPNSNIFIMPVVLIRIK